MKKICATLLLLVVLASGALAANQNWGVSIRQGIGGLFWNMNALTRLGVEAGYVGTSASSTLLLIGRGEYTLLKPDKNTSLYCGGLLSLASAAGTGSISITGLVGAELRISPNIAVFADLNMLSYTQAGSSQTLTLISGDTSVYSGVRVNL